MQELIQQQDGIVLVCSGNRTYQDSSENFLIDYGSPLPANYLLYNKTLRVHVVEGEIKQFRTNTKLSDVIDSLDAVLENQQKRQPIEEPEAPPTQDHETLDPNVLDLAEAVLELSDRLEKLEGGNP